ncbi:MAG: hypothetical protein WCJ58_06420 [bacterium]
MQDNQKKTKRMWQLFLGSIVFLLLLCLSIGIIFSLLWQRSSQSSKEDSSQLNNISASNSTAIVSPQISISTNDFSDYSGKFIRTKLPQGWKIAEYVDGKGTDKLMEGLNYQGITGVSVFDEADQEVFSLKAVWGIGDEGECSEIFKFKDTAQSYIDSINNANVNWGLSKAKIIDLSKNSYQEYAVLGIATRRIGTTLYWNKSATKKEFNPGCGFSIDMVTFDNLYCFANAANGSAPQKVNLFNAAISDNLDDSTLLKLDQVLQSMQVN